MYMEYLDCLLFNVRCSSPESEGGGTDDERGVINVQRLILFSFSFWSACLSLLKYVCSTLILTLCHLRLEKEGLDLVIPRGRTISGLFHCLEQWRLNGRGRASSPPSRNGSVKAGEKQ